MTQEINCFDCNGYETGCEQYYSHKTIKCSWRVTAENDLEKIAKKDTTITLKKMYFDYAWKEAYK